MAAFNLHFMISQITFSRRRNHIPLKHCPCDYLLLEHKSLISVLVTIPMAPSKLPFYKGSDNTNLGLMISTFVIGAAADPSDPMHRLVRDLVAQTLLGILLVFVICLFCNGAPMYQCRGCIRPHSLITCFNLERNLGFVYTRCAGCG